MADVKLFEVEIRNLKFNFSYSKYLVEEVSHHEAVRVAMEKAIEQGYLFDSDRMVQIKVIPMESILIKKSESC